MNGGQIQTATNSGGGTTLTWQQFTTSFVATSASTTIGFFNGDPITDNANGLDNVSLDLAQTTTVPEPSTWLLLGSGIVALAFARRKLSA